MAVEEKRAAARGAAGSSRAEDWAALDAAFEANRDPLTGHAPADEYRPLFQRILDRAPAPIGLGRTLTPPPTLRADASRHGPDPRRRPRRAAAAAHRPHAQAAAAGARPAADRVAPAGAGARPACARWSSTPPGSKSSSPPRSATARAGGCTSTTRREGRDHGGALETAGGIAKALPLAGRDASGSSPAMSSCPAFDFRAHAGAGRPRPPVAGAERAAPPAGRLRPRAPTAA